MVSVRAKWKLIEAARASRWVGGRMDGGEGGLVKVGKVGKGAIA